MTYFTEWLTIISAVIAALSTGFLINILALRRPRRRVSTVAVTRRDTIR